MQFHKKRQIGFKLLIIGNKITKYGSIDFINEDSSLHHQIMIVLTRDNN